MAHIVSLNVIKIIYNLKFLECIIINNLIFKIQRKFQTMSIFANYKNTAWNFRARSLKMKS